MMEIKKKHLNRCEWYSDSDRSYRCLYFKDESIEGGIGLITFTGIAQPDVIETENGQLCMADKGYQWLEIAPVGENFVLTAMIRDNTVFEQYVDISLRNEVAENGDAVFYDLFLDVAVSYDGPPRLLDVDELNEALRAGVVNEEQYKMALNTANRIIVFYRTHREQITRKIMEWKKLFD